MEESPRKARPYQEEILLEARKKNTIVCLGTGTGKTFISAKIIEEFMGSIQGTHATGGKRTFFLVGKVVLARQQAKEIENGSPLKVAYFTGNTTSEDIKIDDWDKNMWIDIFDKNEVLVMTHQILLDILDKGYIGYRNINLLVFDECHNATGKHPYVKILSHESQESCPAHPHHDSDLCTCPRILGLTASVVNTKLNGTQNIKESLEKKMRKLEAMMRARCITCKDPEATSEFGTKPKEIILTFKKESGGVDSVSRIEQQLHERLEAEYQRFREEAESHHRDGKNIIALGHEQSQNEKISEGEQILKESKRLWVASDAMRYCFKALEKLGIYGMYTIANTLIENLNDLKRDLIHEKSRTFIGEALQILGEVVDACQDCKRTGSKCRKRELTGHVSSTDMVELPFITNRVNTLLTDILLAENIEFTKLGEKLHAILFAKRRCTAFLLSKLLNDKAVKDPENYGWLKSDFILGNAVEEYINITESGMKNNQNKVLDKYRKGDFNVLVSTSVVEEGIDIRDCNLVVWFSGIGTYRQYAQSKGRARSSNSKFIIMCAETKKLQTERELKKMQKLEVDLLGICRETRYIPPRQETDKALIDEEKEWIATYNLTDAPDSARITTGNCVGLLHRYCNKLLSQENAFTRHNFVYEKDGDETRATVYLPPDIPLEEKTVTGDWMPTIKIKRKGRKNKKEEKYKYLAKKSVCQIVCIRLHKAGCIDEHTIDLLTENKYDDSDDDTDFDEYDGDIERQNELELGRKEFPRKVPSCLLQKESGVFRLFVISMELTKPRNCAKEQLELWSTQRKGFGILMPSNVPRDVPEMHFFINTGRFSVQLVPLEHTIKDIPLMLKVFHQNIVQQCATKYVKGKMVFEFDNPAIAKGVLIPLKQKVFHAINCGTISQLGNSIGSLIDEDVLAQSEVLQGIATHSLIRKTYLTEAENKKLYYVNSVSDKKAGDIMNKGETYKEYYERKYQRYLDENSKLLHVIPFSTKVSFTDDKSHFERINAKAIGREDLPLELCEKFSSFDVFLHMQMVILPFFLYKYECFLNAREVVQTIAQDIGISDEEKSLEAHERREEDSLRDVLKSSAKVTTSTKSPTTLELLECLTTKQALFGYDLERMEMLGDSFLKQAVTIYLYFRHPQASEEKLTDKRKLAIENNNLHRISLRRGIEQVMCNSQFGNTYPSNNNPLTVWLPPGYSRTQTEEEEYYTAGPYQHIKHKALADCVEALIGLYFKNGGVNLALQFMQKYLKMNVFHSSMPERYQSLFMSDERSFYADFPVANTAAASAFSFEDINTRYQAWRLKRLERRINYTFRDKSYLIQAVTHSSYRNGSQQLTNCYEKLEFLGDAILDFLVTLHVFTTNSRMGPGELTSVRSAVVNNNTLALLVVKHGIEKFIRHFSHVTDCMIKSFKSIIRPEEESFQRYFLNPFIIIPQGSDEGCQAPKVLGDVFEAIIGAIFLDCGMDLNCVWRIIYPLMKDVIDKYVQNVPKNPVTTFIEAYPPPKSSFKYELVGGVMQCTAHFGDRSAMGRGENRKMAETVASWKALKMINGAFD